MAAGINPQSDPEGAVRYVRETLAAFKERQGELEMWFNALAQQVAWGVVSCAEVLRYNASSTSLYESQVDFFTWIEPWARAVERATGKVILAGPEVPLPQLIGTKYTVYNRGGKKVFDVGVECNPDGTFAPRSPRSALQIAPTPTPNGCSSDAVDGMMNGTLGMVAGLGRTVWSPYPTITDLRSIGLGDTSPTTWLTIAQYAMAAIVIGVLGHYAVSLLSEISGTRVQSLNNEAYTQSIRADAARAQCANQCFQGKLTAAGGSVDATASAAMWKECIDGCHRAVPPRDPPYGSSLLSGIMGIVIAGGVIAISVVAIKSASNRRAERSGD